MSDLLDRRAELSAALADAIKVHAETSARRHEQWHAAYESIVYQGDSITAIQRHADHAVWALDFDIIRQRGDIEALRVEIAQIDAVLRAGAPGGDDEQQ